MLSENETLVIAVMQESPRASLSVWSKVSGLAVMTFNDIKLQLEDQGIIEFRVCVTEKKVCEHDMERIFKQRDCLREREESPAALES